jgi:hypothetical protein
VQTTGRLALALFVAAVGGLTALPSAASTTPAGQSLHAIPKAAPLKLKVVRGDTVIAAGYNTTRPLGRAVRRYGPPNSRRRNGVVCNVRWRQLGAQFLFANLGGRNPCANRWGRVGSAKLTGARWQTIGGLKIGDPVEDIPAKAPQAIRCDVEFLNAPPNRRPFVGPATTRERASIRRQCEARSGDGPSGTWWLAPLYSAIGEASFFPRITIVARAGVVRSFDLSVGAAGE